MTDLELFTAIERRQKLWESYPASGMQRADDPRAVRIFDERVKLHREIMAVLLARHGQEFYRDGRFWQVTPDKLSYVDTRFVMETAPRAAGRRTG